MTSQLQDLEDVLTTKEGENMNLNVNFHSEHMENGTIHAPGKMVTKSILSRGAQSKQMLTTYILEENGVTVPLQSQQNAKVRFLD